jgi:hypothetical protein
MQENGGLLRGTVSKSLGLSLRDQLQGPTLWWLAGDMKLTVTVKLVAGHNQSVNQYFKQAILKINQSKRIG